MKVEGEPVVFRSNTFPKFAPKSFEHANDALDSGGMKLEDQKEHASPLKGNEDSNHNNIAADGWVVTKPNGLGLDDFNDYDEVRAFVSPLTYSSKVDLFEENSELYMEKSIVECQLPELIVCYKENISNIVKDICIDEGIPSQDKLSCGISLDEKHVCAILHPEKDQKDKLARKLEKRDIFASGDSEHPESFGSKDSPKQRGSKDLATTPEAEYDVAYLTENMLNLPVTNMIADSLKPLINNQNELHPQSEQVFTETTSLEVPILACVAEESNSNPREAMSASASSSPAPEELKNVTFGNDDISCNSKVENGNITVDSNSLAFTASDGLEHCDNGDFNSSAPSTSASVDCRDTSRSSNPFCHDTSTKPNCVEYEDLRRLEYEDVFQAEVGNSVGHPVSSQIQHGIGETSFSSVVPSRSLMSNSGYIAYSGSISLRSDSSTTSTRSFAFPILQSEWNSSPVRMAKADRKYLRKHRSWKQGILCCRF